MRLENCVYQIDFLANASAKNWQASYWLIFNGAPSTSTMEAMP
jgi:hypothetical protein